MKRLALWLAGLIPAALFGLLLGAFMGRPRVRAGFGITQGTMEPLEATWWVGAGVALGVLICFFLFVRRLYVPEDMTSD